MATFKKKAVVRAAMGDASAAGNSTHNRRLYMGGSDMAAVMGLSPWTTPVELWLQKTGQAPAEVISPRQQRIFDRGHKLEPFIRDMVIDRLRDDGMTVELLACNARYIDVEHPWMSVEIDFELCLTGTTLIGEIEVTFDKEHVNADAKSVSSFARMKWGVENSEDVPVEYAVQFQGGLMVTGRHYCLVAALRSFDDVDIYWTVRDDVFLAGMRPKLVAFWTDHVLGNEPPDPLKFSDIKALYPRDNGLPVEATDEIVEKVRQLKEVKAQIATWKATEDLLTLDIGEFISPHARLVRNGRDVMTFRVQQQERIDADALRMKYPAVAEEVTSKQDTRVLRFVQPKKGSIR